jgi:nucleotide-binding universal stress UspA family protein
MSTNYRIVVGVDGSEGGSRALQWAIREAATRGGTVQAVIAWQWDGFDLPPHAATHPDQEREQAQRTIVREIESVGHPDRASVSIASEAVEGRAADVLTAAARDADLLVLGSHGHSRIRHTVLGSVSEECVRKANCPIVVLPVPQASTPAPAEPMVRAATSRS